MGATEAGPSGSGTRMPLGEGPTAAGPSGLGTTVGASTQTSLSSQPGPSSSPEPEDIGATSAAAVAAARDNSETNAEINDENSEIRRKRVERFSSSTSQESSDKDKKD